jgi:hypothetical protein
MNASIEANVRRIREAVAKAASDAGRDPDDISILAAAKYTDRAGVEALLNAGIRLIGENRVQDARNKLGESEDGSQRDIHEFFPDCRVHMIGHLQSNKVNHALKIFDMVETVDRVSLADALQKRLGPDNRVFPVLIEVKLTSEDTKTGCAPDDLPSLLNYLHASCPNLQVKGLMGMGPWDPDPEVARPFYRALKSAFDSLKSSAPDPGLFATLSMGMSADFHVAIQEGATLVRIGRALFEQV